MALNKSTRSTPSSRSGYLSEITASAGKQTSFLLPVRIKVTPNNRMAPSSDGKKDYTKMMQPVLIKDLLQSTQKTRQNTTLASASTQKKKARAQRSTQPYLNTQSCYKPKQEEDGDPASLTRKSYGGNKVRRQLYQNLDSPQRSTLEGKENTTKNVRPRVKSIRDSEVPATKNSKVLNNRKSLLLPPNSIRNSVVNRKSGNFKPPGKQIVKSNTTVNKSTKNLSRITEAKPLKHNVKKSVQKMDDDVDMELDFSSPDLDEYDRKQSRDSSTMTSPSISQNVGLSKSLSNISKVDRPSVIMSATKVMSTSKNSNNIEPPCLEMQNLRINPTQYSSNCAGFDFTQMNGLDTNGITQFKAFLEQSIRACEDQAFQLKQVLNFVNNVFIDNSKATATNTEIDEKLKIDDKCDISTNTVINSEDNSNVTDIVDKSLEKKEINENVDTSTAEAVKIEATEESTTKITEKLPIPIKILVTDADLNQESKELSSEMLNEIARLSTIGEVSCEGDLSNNKDDKDDMENKENIEDSVNMVLTPCLSPTTPRTPRRRSVVPGSCDSQTRRRSARLAAKRMSMSAISDTDSDKQDSFTMLENELNVVHDGSKGKLPSKSLPASPMKPPVTPGVIRKWDKRVERPLREYMALKMNGTFLVTPDVKRFQSCLETTDTPHSRKSLSRKIFMELCDLYAESPVGSPETSLETE